MRHLNKCMHVTKKNMFQRIKDTIHSRKKCKKKPSQKRQNVDEVDQQRKSKVTYGKIKKQ